MAETASRVYTLRSPVKRPSELAMVISLSHVMRFARTWEISGETARAAAFTSRRSFAFLLPGSHAFKKLFEDGGFDLTYVEAPGDHNWDFWDAFIEKAIEWLPLEEKSEGMDSGNIAASVAK